MQLNRLSNQLRQETQRGITEREKEADYDI